MHYLHTAFLDQAYTALKVPSIFTVFTKGVACGGGGLGAKDAGGLGAKTTVKMQWAEVCFRPPQFKGENHLFVPSIKNEIKL